MVQKLSLVSVIDHWLNFSYFFFNWFLEICYFTIVNFVFDSYFEFPSQIGKQFSHLIIYSVSTTVYRM